MKKYTNLILVLMLSTIMMQMGCENNYPDPIWPPSDGSKPTPVITDIDPDTSYSGIGVVTIIGQNFSANMTENQVFFNGAAGKVLSATTTSIEVQVPNLVEDSILIQVDVKGAFLFGEYGGHGSADVPFILEDALIKYLAVDATRTIGGLACDLSDNIYTVLSSPRGIVQIAVPDCTDLYQYSPSPTQIGYGMKWGPGGYLYMVRKNKNLYRVLPDASNFEIFARVQENVQDLDFDANGNIFTGGKDGLIFRVSSAGDTATVARLGEYDITCIRVYDSYVYSVLDYQGSDTTAVQRGIWRNQILDASGNLGSNEFMFDWDLYAGTTGPNITSMVVDENGMFYLGNSYINNNDNEAITKLDVMTGFAEPLYQEILKIGVDNLCWGNSNYLYIHRYVGVLQGDGSYVYTRELLRLAMPLNSAPYYGRQ